MATEEVTRDYSHLETDPLAGITLVLFDVDGTLVETRSGKTFREAPDDWEIRPGMKEAVEALRAENIEVALVTNQGGAAFGIFDPKVMSSELSVLCQELGLDQVEGFSVCYTHPRGTKAGLKNERDYRRKPGPGMILEQMSRTGIERDATVVVGDREEDMIAADAAGVRYIHTDNFPTAMARHRSARAGVTSG